jgi:hypothetical protein
MYLNILPIFFRNLLNTSNTSKKKNEDRIAWIGKKNFFYAEKKNKWDNV